MQYLFAFVIFGSQCKGFWAFFTVGMHSPESPRTGHKINESIKIAVTGRAHRVLPKGRVDKGGGSSPNIPRETLSETREH